MPSQPTVAQIRFDNIGKCLEATMATLEVVADGLKTPFLIPIANTMRSLLTAIQTVKTNRDNCTQMLEQIHEILSGIIYLHIASNTGGELSPSMLYDLGKFTETLHKVHTFVESHQEKSRIKQFFRQGEMSTLLKGCHLGLREALEIFKVHGLHLSSDVTEMRKYAEKTHLEVLEFISELADAANSDRESMVSGAFSTSLTNSSDSLSLLPAQPKIFHGREAELSAIIQMFGRKNPRIAILGTGGIGKTCLARAVLHAPEIAARYGVHCAFVACDSVTTSVQLAALIGRHVRLKPGNDLTRMVIQYFTSSPPFLLILDNLETIWEPRESREDIEKFMSLLADVDGLAFIITMRGAERPANVPWTHPFLEPLKPLTHDAARKTFVDIADEGHAPNDVDEILRLTDNLPLAIDLMAHLVDYEGLPSVLARWETEKTSLLSEGHDKRSNLDLSISLSVASPRIRSFPQSLDVLSLLSILPDGLSDIELVQIKLPIDRILACKAALLRTSLAYIDDQKRLKVLVPIREYIHHRHPPTVNLVQVVFKYFSNLLATYETYVGVLGPMTVTRITSNFGNIQHILENSLTKDNPERIDAIYCTCRLDLYSRQAGHGRISLMDRVPDLLPYPSDYKLEIYLVIRLFATQMDQPIPNAQQRVNQTLEYLPHLQDSDLECRFYARIADYNRFHDVPRAIHVGKIQIGFNRH
ncbi:P-loop containing nucleoside triphosphate hydrolase protein [Mycena latifolia]|nr:P-loop containing nucleoside triphosphate hydrolase protein [Mycena latifolia]